MIYLSKANIECTEKFKTLHLNMCHRIRAVVPLSKGSWDSTLHVFHNIMRSQQVNNYDCFMLHLFTLPTVTLVNVKKLKVYSLVCMKRSDGHLCRVSELIQGHKLDSNGITAL